MPDIIKLLLIRWSSTELWLICALWLILRVSLARQYAYTLEIATQWDLVQGTIWSLNWSSKTLYYITHLTSSGPTFLIRKLIYFLTQFKLPSFLCMASVGNEACSNNGFSNHCGALPNICEVMFQIIEHPPMSLCIQNCCTL